MEKIKIVIFAKQQSNRQKLHMLLKIEPDFEIIGEAGTNIEIYNYVTVRSLDILVFDLSAVEELDMLRAENHIRQGIKTVVVYEDKNISYTNDMLRSGAKAYVSSESASTELAAAIREVMAGKVHLSYPLFEHAIENYIKKAPNTANALYELLKKRESEVFNMVVKGLTSAQIGVSLAISRRTVEIHRANILRKLNLASQYKQIKNYAVELGILKSGIHITFSFSDFRHAFGCFDLSIGGTE
jgi:DNA-binding NarL/FixJ family response regulator